MLAPIEPLLFLINSCPDVFALDYIHAIPLNQKVVSVESVESVCPLSPFGRFRSVSQLVGLVGLSRLVRFIKAHHPYCLPLISKSLKCENES